MDTEQRRACLHVREALSIPSEARLRPSLGKKSRVRKGPPVNPFQQRAEWTRPHKKVTLVLVLPWLIYLHLSLPPSIRLVFYSQFLLRC
jgi:hypothetical protein